MAAGIPKQPQLSFSYRFVSKFGTSHADGGEN